MDGLIVAVPDRLHDPVADQAHLVRTHAAGRGGRRADPDAGRRVRRIDVERDGVLVDRDADVVQERLRLPTGDAERGHVHEREVVVRAATDQARTCSCDGLRQHAGIDDRPCLVLAEALCLGELEGHRLRGDDVHQRSALHPGEDRLVHCRREGVLAQGREVRAIDAPREVRAREHEAAARATERLVRRGGHEVGMREGTGVQPGRHESGEVGHVHEEQCADAVGDGCQPLEVPGARIGRRAGDHDLGAHRLRLRLERVVVDPFRLAVDPVRVHFIQPAREVDRRAVRQMTAVGEAHAQDPVARSQDREVGGHVRLGTRVRLDVHVVGAWEQGQRTGAGKLLHHVHVLAATVVALAGEALGVLVRQPRTLRLVDRLVDVVLARDELDLVFLAMALCLDRGPDLRVDLLEGRPRC